MALTISDVDSLRTLLGSKVSRASGGVNRGGFYLHYYDLIMADAADARVVGDRTREARDIAAAHQVMIQAEITTYSGFIGGAALIGNAIAKFANPKFYNLTLDQFSWDIADGILNAITRRVQNGSDGILSQFELQKQDQDVWSEKEMKDYFPGNIQLWSQSEEDLLSAGTLSSVMAGLQQVFGLQVGFTQQDAIGKGGLVDSSNSDYSVVKDASGRVLFVQDNLGIAEELTGGLNKPLPTLTQAGAKILSIALGLFGVEGTIGIGSILSVAASSILSENASASNAVGVALRLLFGNISNDVSVSFDLREKFTRFVGAYDVPVDPTATLPSHLVWNSFPIILRSTDTFYDTDGVGVLIGYNDASLQAANKGSILLGFGNSFLSGGGGSDWLAGKDSATLDGGAGNDVLAGTGHVTLLGGDGNDDLLVTAGASGDGGSGDDLGLAYGSAPGGLTQGTPTLRGGTGNDVLLGYAGVSLDGGVGDDLLLYLVPQGSKARATISGGEGNDKVFGFGAADIYLGAGDDILRRANNGSVVYGDVGADTFYIGDKYLIADAGVDDRISWMGLTTLTGGIKWSTSESPWAYGIGGIRYGVDTDGELVIRDWFDNDTYVANFNTDTSGSNRTAGILIGQVTITGYRLTEAPSSWVYTTFETLFGPVLKALTGRSYFGSVNDPLALDLDGDGLELNARVANAPYFDIDGDGFAEQTGWVRGDDGFLVRDLNGNGRIDSVSEMFGNASVSGFAALGALDSNKDGKISRLDTAFSSLRIWKDANGNAIRNAGELLTLAQADVANINLTPTSTEAQTVSGNAIAATGAFTRTNGTTGIIGDINFSVNQRDTVWLGDKTIDATAAMLPELKGYGTLTNLRIAVTDSPALKAALQSVLPGLNTPNLATLRSVVTPILTAWVNAIPVTGDTPGAATHIDVAIRAGVSLTSGTKIYDFAFRTTDASGAYWKLASGAAVRNAAGSTIAKPTFDDVMRQTSTQGSWMVFSGAQIQFLERYVGTPFAIGENNLTGTAAISAAGKLLEFMWNDLNKVVVRLAMQGPLAPYFAGTRYNLETNHFEATTDRALAPMLEAIFRAAPGSNVGALAHLTSWKPMLDVFLQDFDRGKDYLQVSYAFLFQNVVAAYENVGLAASLPKAAATLDIPEDLIRVGTGTVTGGTDADLFYLGAGDQIVKGGLGPDTYVVGKNFGHDVLDDYEGPLKDSRDTLRFAQYNVSDVTLQRDGLDLVIRAAGPNNDLRIIGQFRGQRGFDPDYGVQEIIFANGTVWDRLDIAKAAKLPSTAGNDTIVGTDTIDFLDGGAGNDTLRGFGEGDVYSFGIGSGQDIIIDSIGYISVDTPDIVQFKANVTVNNIAFTRNGNSNDLVIKINGTPNRLTIKDQFVATYTGSYGTQWLARVEVFSFTDGQTILWDEVMSAVVAAQKTAGNDKIYGFSVEDTLDGGAGNDYLSGGDENDTYIFGIGYGRDLVDDRQDNILSGNTDSVRFAADVLPANVTFTRTGASDDLVIKIRGTQDQLTVKDQFVATYTGVLGTVWLNRVEIFSFSNGQSVLADDVLMRVLQSAKTAGNDRIYGFSVQDTLDGGAGNDYLSGGNEDDTYVFGLGYGRDTIDDKKDNILSGGTDTLRFNSGILPSDIVLSRKAASDDITITLKDGSSVLISGQLSLIVGLGVYEFNRIERFQFADGTLWTHDDVRQKLLDRYSTSGNDSIYGYNVYDDTLIGGLGNDRMAGGSGDDTYIHKQGDGTDTITEEGFGGDNDLLLLTGAALSSVNAVVTRSPTDAYTAILTFKGATDRIVLTGEFGWNAVGVEGIGFSDGVIWTRADLKVKYLALVSTAGNNVIVGFDESNDIITGGLGNDRMPGGSGDDTYIHKQGDGNDTIIEEGGGGANDRLLLTGAALSSVNAVVTRSPTDAYTAILTFKGATDRVVLTGEFGWNAVGVEGIGFSDGVTWTTADLKVRYLASISTAGNDSIVGFDESNDIITGGLGNDRMAGGSGDDTYIHKQGDGNDTIIEEGGGGANDLLLLTGAALSSVNAVVTRSPTDAYTAILTFKGATDRVVLTGEFGWNAVGVEGIGFSDGATWTTADLKVRYLASVSTAGNDSIVGFDESNDIIIGGLGTDILMGGTGADVIKFLAAADSMVGSGRDIIADFSTAQGDVIDLTAIDANDLLPGDQAFRFVGSNAFTGAHGEARFFVSGSNTVVEGSIGGAGADFQIQISGAVQLYSTDFRL